MVETESEILAATQTVLMEEGYHGLTTAGVADAAGVSQPLVHHYFGTKGELVGAFLEYYREQVSRALDALRSKPPDERLVGLISLLTENVADADSRDLYLAVCELQAYAGRYDEYGEALTEYSGMLQRFVVETIEEGIEAGVFEACDPNRTARLLLTAVDGALFQEATVGADTIEEAVHGGLVEYVLADLYVGTPPEIGAVSLSPEKLQAERQQMEKEPSGANGGGGDE